MAFAYYTPVTIDHTKVGGSNLTNFPLLLTGNIARFATVANGGHVESSTGKDIRAFADTGQVTALPFQKVAYNPVSGLFEYYVNVPSVSASVSSIIYLFYGDPTISTDGSSATTWNSNIVGTWHYGDGTTLSFNDATSGGSNGVAVGSPANLAGAFGGGSAVNLFGSDFVRITDSGALNLSGDFTVEFWVIGNSIQQSFSGLVLKRADNPTQSTAYGPQLGFGDIVGFFSDGTHFDTTIPTGSINDGAWHQVVITKTTTTISAYLDGSFVTSGSPIAQDTGTGDLLIGTERTEAQSWVGGLDETRISDIANPPGLISANYSNQSSPSTFVSYGTEVPLGSAGGPFPFFTRRNGLGGMISMNGGL